MIAFIHLYNDRSGSPRVLNRVIETISKENECKLFIGSDGNGILDEHSELSVHYWYKRTRNSFFTLVTYMISQVCLFHSLMFNLNHSKRDVIYINTLLPFGAAIYGWITGRKVIYHLHEVSLQPIIFQKFLTYIAKTFASHLIYVSRFHRESLPIDGVPYTIIHNVIDKKLLVSAKDHKYIHRRNGFFTIYMLSTGRDYKGVYEFIALARKLVFREDIIFRLALSVDESNIRLSEEKNGLPCNLEFLDSTHNPSKYYMSASLVVNLSRVDLCQETFGLTILEAMSFGVPVIAPPVGGPTEIVTDGADGFLVDSRDLASMQKKIIYLAENPNVAMKFSIAAKAKAVKFDVIEFENRIRRVVNEI